jgi:hypothetical protein
LIETVDGSADHRHRLAFLFVHIACEERREGGVESKQPLVKECGRRSGNRRDLGKTRLNQLYLFKGHNSPSRLKSNPEYAID